LSKLRPNEAFRKVIQKIREFPAYPRDLEKSTKLTNRVVDACLRRGIFLGIFKQLGDKRYAWIDYVEIEEEVRQVKEDFELLTCRAPDLDELSLLVGFPPGEMEKKLYLLGPRKVWRPPTDQDKTDSPYRAMSRLELAAWIKLGCGETPYVKENWAHEEFKKAERILEKHPGYVPKIEAYTYRDTNEGKFHYRLVWPKESEGIVIDRTRRLKSRMASAKEFEKCVELLGIKQRSS
jgi:hypothetical protein